MSKSEYAANQAQDSQAPRMPRANAGYVFMPYGKQANIDDALLPEIEYTGLDDIDDLIPTLTDIAE